MENAEKIDLGKETELSFAVMNLIEIEEHLAFTAAKTRKQEYLDLQLSVRKLRSKYLKKIVKNESGECWCIAKHLLSTTMRLMETAVKQGASGNKKEAMELLNDAIECYQLFWLIQQIKPNKAK